jgi:hypothetical protein
MPSRLLPNLGLRADWALGEDLWKDEMDANLLALSIFVQGRALDLIDATPGAPAEGDVYLTSAAHPTQPNKVAAYDEGAWKYFTPLSGFKLYNVAAGADYQFGTEWAELSGGPPHVVLTQAEYDALDPADDDTFYFIPEEEA